MKLIASTYTRPGTRTINEDYVTFYEKNGRLLLIVADGLGGYDKGEVASKYVCTYMEKHFDFETDSDIELGRVIKGAQVSLLEKQVNEKAVATMKTTVVALAIKGDKAYFGHVGDSRGYAFDKKRNYIRTLDHSVPQMLVLAGDIKEKEIRYHAERSSLLRVLGSPWEKDAFEVSDEMDVRKTKAFLLCSDGFWELIDERNMMKCLKKSKTPEEWLSKMAKIIERKGVGKEMDNYTAGAVFVMEDDR